MPKIEPFVNALQFSDRIRHSEIIPIIYVIIHGMNAS